MPLPDSAMPEVDAVSAEFALVCREKLECNSAATVQLNTALKELIKTAKVYRKSVVPGGSEVHFGYLAHAVTELEYILKESD